MNRGKVGFFLLIVLLVAGLLSSWGMYRFHEDSARDLEQAAEFALSDQWPQALSLAQKARQSWQNNWHFSACFADHGPMEEIDGLFSQLEVYASREKLVFAALCAELSRQLEAMGDAHGLGWWNLL